ncbi:MAG: Protein YeeZ [Candidatus Marinimicrobia bacterium]|nr:Protein YeeZ [Candidatus Neomarinimicrobiota bacterium]
MIQFEHIFIIGCGDIGQRVAKIWLKRSFEVFALTHSEESVVRLQSREIMPIRGDLDAADTLQDLPVHNALVYYFAPPPRSGETAPRMANFLRSIPDGALPVHLLYISTSGVYGDTGGDWVTEESPLNPKTERSKRRVDAEQQILEWAAETGVPYTILRVPGIYGTGRLPIEKVKSGRPVLREKDAPYSNRIHADDLARICVNVVTNGKPNEIYNVSDGNPGSITQYYFILADLLGIERPPTISMEEAREQFSPMLMSFLEESKRLDISKLRNHLGYEPLYPSLEKGLQASLAEQ